MAESVVVNQSEQSLLKTLHVTYALHALGIGLGALGAATVLGSFIFGWPSIIAVIINYMKRGEARGSWMHTHVEWQIRTFWFALAWTAAVAIGGAILLFVYVGILVWLIGFVVLSIWAVYRIARGWRRLYHGRPAYE